MPPKGSTTVCHRLPARSARSGVPGQPTQSLSARASQAPESTPAYQPSSPVAATTHPASAAPASADRRSWAMEPPGLTCAAWCGGALSQSCAASASPVTTARHPATPAHHAVVLDGVEGPRAVRRAQRGGAGEDEEHGSRGEGGEGDARAEPAAQPAQRPLDGERQPAGCVPGDAVPDDHGQQREAAPDEPADHREVAPRFRAEGTGEHDPRQGADAEHQPGEHADRGREPRRQQPLAHPPPGEVAFPVLVQVAGEERQPGPGPGPPSRDRPARRRPSGRGRGRRRRRSAGR